MDRFGRVFWCGCNFAVAAFTGGVVSIVLALIFMASYGFSPTAGQQLFSVAVIMAATLAVTLFVFNLLLFKWFSSLRADWRAWLYSLFKGWKARICRYFAALLVWYVLAFLNACLIPKDPSPWIAGGVYVATLAFVVWVYNEGLGTLVSKGYEFFLKKVAPMADVP